MLLDPGVSGLHSIAASEPKDAEEGEILSSWEWETPLEEVEDRKTATCSDDRELTTRLMGD